MTPEDFRQIIREEIAAHGADPLLTIPQAARRMNISVSTAYKLVGEGKLKTAPGLTEKRVKQSTADNYGKEPSATAAPNREGRK